MTHPVPALVSPGTYSYRGYLITYDPFHLGGFGSPYSYVHEDYDGAPDSGDRRCGSAVSVEDAVTEIDDLEDDA